MPLIRRSALSRSKPANASGWRLLVAIVATIAFLSQSFIAQTHIHFSQQVGAISTFGSGSIIKETTAAPATKQGPAPANRTPANDDSAKCPLCQAVGYAGHFLAPSAAALLLPSAAISILPLAPTVLSARETPSHIWQGRGPPTS